MVRFKLEELKTEISKYIGIPYFINIPPIKLDKLDLALIGKGSAKDIALKTIEFANLQDIKLSTLTSDQIYEFQKNHGIGIDCSGLATNLLNYMLGSNVIPVTKTSAAMLTSEPLSIQVPLSDTKTGDLIRQKNGKHVLFVIEQNQGIVYYVHSSSALGGVHYGDFDISKPNIEINGIYRLKQLT